MVTKENQTLQERLRKLEDELVSFRMKVEILEQDNHVLRQTFDKSIGDVCGPLKRDYASFQRSNDSFDEHIFKRPRRLSLTSLVESVHTELDEVEKVLSPLG